MHRLPACILLLSSDALETVRKWSPINKRVRHRPFGPNGASMKPTLSRPTVKIVFGYFLVRFYRYPANRGYIIYYARDAVSIRAFFCYDLCLCCGDWRQRETQNEDRVCEFHIFIRRPASPENNQTYWMHYLILGRKGNLISSWNCSSMVEGKNLL